MKEFYIDCTKLGAPDKYERTKKNNATDEEVYDIIDEFIWYDKGYLVTCKNGTVTNVKNLSSDYLKEHYDGYRVLSFRHSVITADLSSREIRLKIHLRHHLIHQVRHIYMDIHTTIQTIALINIMCMIMMIRKTFITTTKMILTE